MADTIGNKSTSACGGVGYVPIPPRLWSRAGGNNCLGASYSTYELDQRRKAEILKYKKNGAQLSQAQQYSMASRNALTRKKAWATQTQTYTNPNVDNLPEIKIPINSVMRTVSLQCNGPANRCSLTSDSDVPGPVIPLCINDNVPLYNYKMQVTYPSGGGTNYIVSVPPPTPTYVLNTITLLNAVSSVTVLEYYTSTGTISLTPVVDGFTVYGVFVLTGASPKIRYDAPSSVTLPVKLLLCGSGGFSTFYLDPDLKGGGGGGGGVYEGDTSFVGQTLVTISVAPLFLSSVYSTLGANTVGNGGSGGFFNVSSWTPGSAGACGGGGGAGINAYSGTSAGGAGTPGVGYNGASGTIVGGIPFGGGGGGAGGSASGSSGGQPRISSIRPPARSYGSGGNGSNVSRIPCEYGGGGCMANSEQSGCVIIQFPSYRTL